MSVRRAARLLFGAAVAQLALVIPAGAEGFRIYQGHGGPVMDVAVAPGGEAVLTASFDYSVGLWQKDAAPRWLEGHRAAVNDVAFLGADRAVSGGDDFAVIVWNLATGAPLLHLEGHRGKVVSVRPSPDGRRLASASWDGTIRLWDLASGALQGELAGHQGSVNDVVWAEAGQSLISAGSDGQILVWDLAAGTASRALARHGFGVNRLAIDEAQGWLAYGAVDGGTRMLDLATGAELADLTLDRRPILALARSRDGSRLAVGDGEGYIMVVETATWRITRDFRAAARGPIWALDFTVDGSAVIAAGIADEAYRFPLDAQDQPRLAELGRAFHTDPDEVSNGERQFLRKCSVCHTLGPDGERRAGPSLHGIFGRPAGSLQGYSYSPALLESGITWQEDTIDQLFALGPEVLTPGSKMPMQQIASPQDRADLIAFLRRETAP